ncbi:MAG TPA: DcaP family trimeric outer membrane transporter [Rhizomicrobium sp.]|nr:DcaP family trimeric outer membrane transporter [Rhizomicrobium sp.]
MLTSRTSRARLSVIAGLAAAALPSLAHADTNKFVFNIYGFAEADYIYDGNRVDPSWEDTLRPTKIPTDNSPAGVFGSNGQSLFSVKQSRFGVSGDLPVKGGLGDIKFKFEFDLFGVGVDAGQTTFRLRHAYGEWGWLLAGQTNSVFMDGDVFPNTIDYWGPNGMVFYRNVQIRVTPWRTEHSHFAIAIERPGNDIDAGTIRQLDPVLGANIRNDEKLPDLTAHFYTSDTWGHFQFAAILRNVGFETIGTPHNEPKGSEIGWGINLSGHLNLLEKDRLLGQVVYGEGIANYMNDAQTDLAPRSLFPGDIRPKAVPLLGIVAYYDHYWNDEWSTSLGYSLVQLYNTNLQEPSAFHKGQYASINLLYTPASDILIGVEGLWGERNDFNGASGHDMRVQFSVKYNFGTTITL